jgi:hypothetical protein
MRIGTLQQTQKNRINFKNWVKEYWQKGTKIELKIIRIFLPAKFNNFTLICYDEVNNLEVSRTLNADLGKQLLKEFKFTVKFHNPFILYLIVDEQGNQDVIKRENNKYGYLFENNSFVLRDLDEVALQEDNLPF